MAIEFDRTLAISITVSDLVASRDWYLNCLGMDLVLDVPEADWCELGFGVEGITFGLTQAEANVRSDTTVPTLGVRDIAAARATLEAAGVVFDGETVEVPGMVKLAGFQDPDGNRLCLAQSLMG